MTTLTTKIQLAVFGLVAVLSMVYGAVTLFDVGSVVRPPYQVEAQFSGSGGIYPRADVDLLGTKVGTVTDVRVGPGSGTTVVMAIDPDVEISTDVTAFIGHKSAIGEQYVALTPKSDAADGAVLKDGSVIPMSATATPIEVSDLLSDLDGLAASIPPKQLGIVLDEMAAAVSGLGPTMGRLLDDADTVTRTSLAHVDELTALITDARTVLDTQVALGPQTTAYFEQLAPLLEELRALDPQLAQVFVDGLRAGRSLTDLLRDNQEALPVLLTHLVSLTDLAADRIPGLRKTIAMFPWVLEVGATGVRPCDEYDAHTGRPIESTCRYDEQGRPIYTTYLAFQMSEAPGGSPYLPCTKGYEGTVKYQPNGESLNGGPREQRDSPPNIHAHCGAAPSDPASPNVRGSQNVPPP